MQAQREKNETPDKLLRGNHSFISEDNKFQMPMSIEIGQS